MPLIGICMVMGTALACLALVQLVFMSETQAQSLQCSRKRRQMGVLTAVSMLSLLVPPAFINSLMDVSPGAMHSSVRTCC